MKRPTALLNECPSIVHNTSSIINKIYIINIYFFCFLIFQTLERPNRTVAVLYGHTTKRTLIHRSRIAVTLDYFVRSVFLCTCREFWLITRRETKARPASFAPPSDTTRDPPARSFAGAATSVMYKSITFEIHVLWLCFRLLSIFNRFRPLKINNNRQPTMTVDNVISSDPKRVYSFEVQNILPRAKCYENKSIFPTIHFVTWYFFSFNF